MQKGDRVVVTDRRWVAGLKGTITAVIPKGAGPERFEVRLDEADNQTGCRTFDFHADEIEVIR